jgi:peptidoglycan/xylan/chitin deacetylase (PgdA/CDA1 family)
VNKPSVYVTFDYELFFGPHAGSVEACILSPTTRLISLAEQYGVRFTFFVDAGMLCAMRANLHHSDALKAQYQAITSQIAELDRLGHAVQLHIHPHWEDAVLEGNSWRFDVTRYRIDHFSEADAGGLIRRYHVELQSHIKKPLTAFRAGGWCIQPFENFRSAFEALGITTDSSLYANGHMNTYSHQFDFRGMPTDQRWRFSTDPMMKDAAGAFIEIPIAATAYSQFFYAKMLLNRLFKNTKYAVLGDGRAIGGGRKRQLQSILRGDHGVVSLDSFRCTQVESALKRYESRHPDGHFVIIAHPKALSQGSFEVLARLAKKHKLQFNVL